MSLTLPHRTASSRSYGCWEFDPARSVVILCVQNPDASTQHIEELVCVDIPVCTEQRPRHNHYSLQRIADNSWVISPSCFHAGPKSFRVTHYPSVQLNDPKTGRTHDVYAVPREAIALSNAPQNVCDELAEI